MKTTLRALLSEYANLLGADVDSQADVGSHIDATDAAESALHAEIARIERAPDWEQMTIDMVFAFDVIRQYLPSDEGIANALPNDKGAMLLMALATYERARSALTATIMFKP